MAGNKKPRKPHRVKGASPNVLVDVFGGMGTAHANHLRTIQIRNHRSLAEMAQGRGTREQWDLLVGAANMANVLCEQGIGDEGRAVTIAARDALLEVGKRIVTKGRVLMKGDELNAIRAGLEWHDTQLENIRAIDVERAYNEVQRRIRGRINSTSVARELRAEKDHANAA